MTLKVMGLDKTTRLGLERRDRRTELHYQEMWEMRQRSLKNERPMGWQRKQAGVISVIQAKQEYHGGDSSWPPQMLLPGRNRRPSVSHGDDIRHPILMLQGTSLCTWPLIH